MNSGPVEIKEKIKNLPGKPGVYQYYDSSGRIIYIGKAKNLKKRVSSYFNKKDHDTNKIKMLVSRIRDLEYIVVDSESEALLLENNLIKKYQPKYNAQLKDDKTFPWICIKNEPFPRVFVTRNVIRDGSLYFGPYTSTHMVRILIDLIRKLYPLRTCKYNLTRENIQKGKFKPCLEYHIGNCKAPCVGYQDEEDYNQTIQQVKKIVRGNIQEVIDYLEQLMNEYSKQYKFEEAQNVKEKIQMLEKYKSRSTVVNPKIKDLDVFTYLQDKNSYFINFLKVSGGRIVQAHTIELKRKLNETIADLLPRAVVNIRERLQSFAPEIVLPEKIELPLDNVKITIPKQGDKLRLIELSQRNLKYYKFEKQKQKEKIQKKFDKAESLEKLRKDLRMEKTPVHIECFDNSNIQGAYPVAACVVFRNGKPSNSEYRHFNIKSVEGPDDFASMREVVFRRYKKLLNEGSPLPQLVVIDGGKGQLSAAAKSLKELEIDNQITLIGIAKKLEEIFFVGDPVPLYLDKQSVSLRIIQHLRDEAHRFGIEFHRQKRSQKFTSTELEKIPGIGPKTIQQLLEKYKTTTRIRKLSENELAEIIGSDKAKKIKEYFKE